MFVNKTAFKIKSTTIIANLSYIFSRLLTALSRRLRGEDMVDVHIRRLRNLGPLDETNLATGKDILLLCPAYPGGSRTYGGEFIQRRVEGYLRAGLSVSVIEIDLSRSETQEDDINDVSVLRCNLQSAADYIALENPKQLVAHQVKKPIWNILKPWLDHVNITIWIHGAEARHWRELESSYSSQEISNLKPQLDRQTQDRKETMTEILNTAQVKKIIVSQFMAKTVQAFTKANMLNVEVIHNPILQRDFPYVEKSNEQRYNILWVRSFNSFNYSNDLCRDVILLLSKREFFEKLKFTIQGDGRYFDEITTPLKKFPNVDIRKGFVSTSGLRVLHRQHGILLVPSRWESQGLTCGEGMASGLVPVTTDVAALPEFVDETCGFLCPKDDASALAYAIETLVADSELFLEKSRNAANRAATQCGEEATLVREINWLREVMNKS